MDKKQQFIDSVKSGYSFTGETIYLGNAVLDGEVIKDLPVRIPLKTLNRHGLISGATGTGKTKTLQILAEQLSANGIPVLMMDIKGDLSGIAMPGVSDAKISERAAKLNIQFIPESFPVELLTISGSTGIQLRADVSEFGPLLFSKILGLNDTQTGITAMLFKYADDKALPLLDLNDFKKLLQFASDEGKSEIEKEFGKISTASTGTILRKVIALEQQGAEVFFGEPSFDVNDLLRKDLSGKGIINILRVNDIQNKPDLFSTFMLTLLAEVYEAFPEEGDLEKPKLVLFIDEAHLIFNEASDELLKQIETIVKLIRSKGIGVFFCTQNPVDVPESILSQLGLKVQHALRAFTAKDNKNIKQTAQNYPISDFYKTETLLTSLGIGEAAVTALNEKGIPTPLCAVHLKPPSSRMGILADAEITSLVQSSQLNAKYKERVDRTSAYEMLTNKIEKASEPVKQPPPKSEKGTVEKMLDNSVTRQMGRTAVREITRGIFGILGFGKKKKGFFG